ncbi:MAG TPA: hypothetical protein PK854_11910 [Oscillospiraceae bacterium]|nr:hypothetical protein [Oscillospiraceae bacterium]HPS35957.1 hypothetical protein [Oscillospiraceae bacterium]
MTDSILIKDTTREARIEIIKRSLNVCGDACEGCTLCDGLTGLGDPWEMYQPYIDGEKEISQINREFRTLYTH